MNIAEEKQNDRGQDKALMCLNSGQRFVKLKKKRKRFGGKQSPRKGGGGEQ